MRRSLKGIIVIFTIIFSILLILFIIILFNDELYIRFHPSVEMAIHRSSLRNDMIGVLSQRFSKQSLGDINELKKIARLGSEKEQVLAITVLSWNKNPELKNLFISLLQSPSGSVRSSAIVALTKLRSNDVIIYIRERLLDTDERVRQSAIQSVGVLKDDASIPMLRSLLVNGTPKDRWLIAHAFGEIESMEVVSDLQILMKDENAQVRQFAVLSSGKIRATELLPMIESLIKDQDPDVRDSAKEVFIKLKK